MFRTCDNKGFHLTFPNGVTLSTQFGYCNYCDNYDGHIRNTEKSDEFDFQRMHGAESSDAEIAIWVGKDKKWITKECPYCSDNDSVCGRVDMEKWLKILDWCKNYTTPKEQ